MAKQETLKPEKVEITDDLLKAIRFEERVLGRNPDGALRTTPTPPSATDWFLRDSKTQGFAIRVTRKGIRFYAQRKLAGRPCLFPCGKDPWPDTTITQARKNAVAALGLMTAGKDPNLEKKKHISEVREERDRARLTLGFILERHRENRAEADAKSTHRDRLDVEKWIGGLAIWSKPVHEIGQDDIQAMIESIRKKRGDPSAVKVWRYVRSAWNAMPASETPPVDPFGEWGKSHTLPVVRRRQTSLAVDDKRDREWLRAVVALRAVPGKIAFPRRVMADYVLLTLCWGARRSEAAALRKEDIDFERAFVVFRDTKSKRDHFFPLSPGCAAVMKSRIADNEERGDDGGWVFPSRQKGKHLVEPGGALDVGKDESGVRVAMHDLRRAFAGEVAASLVGEDGNASAGMSLVKVAMNHADAMTDVTQGYVMVKARLKMLRPIYLAQERRVFEAAGLSDLLPESDAMAGMIEILKSKASDPKALEKIRKVLGL